MTVRPRHFPSRLRHRLGCLLLAAAALVWVPPASAQPTAEEWYQTGFQRILEGKRDEAVAAFIQALELKPGWAEAHHQLGVLYFENQEGPAAVFHLREAERAYRDRPDAQARRNLEAVRRNLQKAYARLGLEPEAFDKAEFKTPPPAGQWVSHGVGFLVGRGGHVVVPRHSVLDARAIRVRFAEGATVPAELVRSFIVYNIAVLKLKQPAGRPGFHLAGTAGLRSGDPVYAPDFSKWEKGNNLVLSGPLLEVDAVDQGRQIFQIGIPLDNSHTGSPLFNTDGAVVGMLFSVGHIQKMFEYFKKPPPDSSFALKSDYFLKVLPGIPGIDPAAVRPSKDKPPGVTPAADPGGFSTQARPNLVVIETQL